MTDRDKFEAWWFAAPEGGASYEQVYGRSYREVAFLAWGMAAEEAVRLEREACAKLCEEVAADNGFYFPPNESRAEAKDCAAAIRARSEVIDDSASP